jgi:hypothetical protein
MKLTTQIHLVLKSRMVELYFQSPTKLHGILLNELGMETSTFLHIKPNISMAKLSTNEEFGTLEIGHW